MEKVLRSFTEWFLSRKKYGGFPAKGTMAGALVVLDRLKEEWDLQIDAQTAEGGTQIKGASGAAIKRILEQFGETRPFLTEGGRTNRGLRGDIVAMLTTLGKTGLERARKDERIKGLEECQRFLVQQIREYHNRQRIEIVFDPAKTTRDMVKQILETATERKQSGQVAQYLVGAKLELRFPSIAISNESYSTADKQRGRPGDFQVGDTAFHVTMMPMDSVYERCKRNVGSGLRVYLLVPDDHVGSARLIAKERVPGRIAVESIESFVGQNVEELAAFSQQDLNQQFFKLLEIYNKRVDAIENDKSIMIEIPANLSKYRDKNKSKT